MDLLAIMQRIWRYKLATLPVIMLTVVGLAYATVLKPKVYQAQASYLLVNPPGPPTTQEIAQNPGLAKLHWDNPYVRFGDLSVVVQVLTQAMSTNSVRQELLGQGVEPNYVVSPSVQFGIAPIFQVVASGPSPSAAMRSASLVSAATTRLFGQLQAGQGVSRQFWITALPLEIPDTAQLQVSSLLRTAVAILGAGVIMLFVVLSVLGGLAERAAMTQSGAAEHYSMEPFARILPSAVQPENGAATANGAAVGTSPPVETGAFWRRPPPKYVSGGHSSTTAE